MSKVDRIMVALGVALVVSFCILGYGLEKKVDQAQQRQWTYDSQYAAGEWKIQVQTPPCEGHKNFQVLYPAHSGEPVLLECDLMPVGTK